MNLIGMHNIFLPFFQENDDFFRKIFSGGKAPRTPQNVDNRNFSNVHKIFQTEGSFQTAENEGSFLVSKPRNGPNRGRFITVL